MTKVSGWRTRHCVGLVPIIVATIGCGASLSITSGNAKNAFAVDMSGSIGIFSIGVWKYPYDTPLWYLQTDPGREFPFRISSLKWGEVPAGMRQLVPAKPELVETPKVGEHILVVVEAVEQSISKGGHTKYEWFAKIPDGFRQIDSPHSLWSPNWRHP